MALFGQTRAGSLFAAGAAAALPAGWTELGRGSAVLGDDVNTVLDSAIVPDGNVVLVTPPTINTEGIAQSVLTGNTNASPAINTLAYDLVKSNAVVDQQEYHARSNTTGASRTIDWIWYQISAS